MVTKIKTFKEFKVFMDRGGKTLGAIFGDHPDFNALVDAIGAYAFYKKHPRKAYKIFLEEGVERVNFV